MQKNHVLLLLALCFSITTFSQVNGSFYTMQLGATKLVFRYAERPDTIQIETDSQHSTRKGRKINPQTFEIDTIQVKDTIVRKRTLTLQNNNKLNKIHIRQAFRIDSAIVYDKETNKESIEALPKRDAEYYIETTMSYSDFLILLKSRFELRNPQKNLQVYSYSLYYESASKDGFINVNYPATSEGVISKLNCLADTGGFVLLFLRGADHDDVTIYPQYTWHPLIHINK